MNENIFTDGFVTRIKVMQYFQVSHQKKEIILVTFALGVRCCMLWWIVLDTNCSKIFISPIMSLDFVHLTELQESF